MLSLTLKEEINNYYLQENIVSGKVVVFSESQNK